MGEGLSSKLRRWAGYSSDPLNEPCRFHQFGLKSYIFLLQVTHDLPEVVKNFIAPKIPALQLACSTEKDIAKRSLSSLWACNLWSAWDLVRSRALNASGLVWFGTRFCSLQLHSSAGACATTKLLLLWVQRIGIPLASACPLCLNAEVSILHLLFLCPISVEAWIWFCAQCKASSVSLL